MQLFAGGGWGAQVVVPSEEAAQEVEFAPLLSQVQPVGQSASVLQLVTTTLHAFSVLGVQVHG